MPTFTGTTGNDTLTGTEEADIINGLAGDDQLYGLGGDDTTDGGTGDDLHIVESAGDIVIERAGEGDDRVVSSVSYALGAGVHAETLTTAHAAGSEAINLTGNELAQSIYGNAGNNVLNGGGGADYLVGLGGNDSYIVNDSRVVVAEAAGDGDDEIITSVNYALAAGAWVETLRTSNAASTDALNLSGNEIAQSIYGNAGNNVLNGGGGNDFLVGLEGNDYLLGGGGTDSMLGGTGNDTYTVDLVAGDRVGFQNDGAGEQFIRLATVVDPGDGQTITIAVDRGNGTTETRTVPFSQVFGADTLIELTGEGDDVVLTYASYVLRAGVSIETLVAAEGTANITLRGNELANSIYGNAGNNLLFGGEGADYLVGGAGNDTLNGDLPTNELASLENSARNADVMAGGGGNDSYVVNHAGDRVIETAGEGFDRVDTSVSYRLAPGADVEVLAATNFTSGIDVLAGNELTQTIIGNNFGQRLSSGGGADTLNGQGGDDTYDVSDGRETIIETAGGGNDTVLVSTDYTLNDGARVETISTYWMYGDEDFDITGNEAGQSIIGNFGSNILDGRGGSDTLIGLGGADTYAFTTALGSNFVDRIVELESGIDTIALDDAIFTTLSPGDLPAGAFAVGSAATEADDRIIYDPATGRLFYDPDGVGGVAAVQFAQLEPNRGITGSDFLVI